MNPSPQSSAEQSAIDKALQHYQPMRKALSVLRQNGEKGLALQQAKEAFACLEQASEILPYMMDAANNLATLYGEAGDWVAAEKLFERSLAVRTVGYGRYHENTATAFMMLGMAKHSLKKNTDALDLLEACLSIREHVFGKEHPQVALVLLNLATVYQALGQYHDAAAMQARVETLRALPEVRQFLQMFGQ